MTLALVLGLWRRTDEEGASFNIHRPDETGIVTLALVEYPVGES